jgi:hypothetical protein
MDLHKTRSLTGASGAGLLGRLRTTLKLGVGGTGMEVGLDAAAGRSLERAVVKAEKQLRRHDDIADVAAFAGGPPPAVYFRCRGTACRAVTAGIFWTAAIDNEVAVLLVGSASNAIAAKRSAPDDVFSPSADPIGAVRYLLQDTAHGETPTAGAAMDGPGHESSPAEAGTLAYAWEALLERDLNLVGDDIDALPRALSVAQYVTRYRFQRGRPDWQAGVNWLVLGTPIYVAQVSKITN